MLIQPYVENAIWHGVLPKEEKGMIKVEMKLDGEKIFCSIEDDGIGRQKAQELTDKNDKDGGKSSGMYITKSRLEALWAKRNMQLGVQVVDLENEQGNPSGTRVELFLPTDF